MRTRSTCLCAKPLLVDFLADLKIYNSMGQSKESMQSMVKSVLNVKISKSMTLFYRHYFTPLNKWYEYQLPMIYHKPTYVNVKSSHSKFIDKSISQNAFKLISMWLYFSWQKEREREIGRERNRDRHTERQRNRDRETESVKMLRITCRNPSTPRFIKVAPFFWDIVIFIDPAECLAIPNHRQSKPIDIILCGV